MLTLIQKRHLAAYTCPHCDRKLGRYHAYRIVPDTLLSRLTESLPSHLECALDAPPPTEETDTILIWTVKSRSPTSPSARVFERLPGDLHLHLFTPDSLTLLTAAGSPLRYEQIRELMFPAIARARDAATSEDEITELARAIAALHPYLPKPSNPRQ